MKKSGKITTSSSDQIRTLLRRRYIKLYRKLVRYNDGHDGLLRTIEVGSMANRGKGGTAARD